MQIREEDDVIRLEDAYRHDEVMIMVGDPETGRPLLTLSVTKNGDALIECEHGNLARGIRQLNEVLSQTISGSTVQNLPKATS